MKKLQIIIIAFLVALSICAFASRPVKAQGGTWTFTLSYTVVGGGSPTAPTFNYIAGGEPTSIPLTSVPTPYTVDASTAWSLTPNPLLGSTGTEQWVSNDVLKGMASADFSYSFTYWHQFQVTPYFTVSDSSSPDVNNAFAYTRFGNQLYATPTLGSSGGSPVFVDAGSSLTYASPINSGSERWQVASADSGTHTAIASVSSATPITVKYYDQYSFQLDYSVSGGGSPTPPVLTATQFGSSYTPTLGEFPVTYWLDSGQPWSVTNLLGGSGSTEQWISAQTVSGTVSASSPTTAGNSLTFTYNHQYYLTVTSAYGSPIGAGWYNSGTSASFAVTTPSNVVVGQSQQLFTSWSGSGTGAYSGSAASTSATMNSPITETALWQLQYYLTVTGGNSPTGQGWYNNGADANPSNAWIWGQSDGTRTALTNWQLDGANQNPTRQSTGTFTTPNIVMNNYHTVNFVSATQYLLTVSGGNDVSYGTASPTGDNWYDSTQSTTVTSNGIFNRASGSGMRVSSWKIDTGAATNVATAGNVITSSMTMSSAHTVTFNELIQYQVSLDSAATSALAHITSPAIPGDNYWYDSGTLVSLTLNGVYGRFSGTGSRVTGYEINGGAENNVLPTMGTVIVLNSLPISSTQSITTTVINQYQVSLDSGATSALSSITSSTVYGDDYWYDSGTSVTLVLNGVFDRSVNSGLRLSGYTVNGGPNNAEYTVGAIVVLNALDINSAQSITTITVTQFFLTVTGGNGISYGTSSTIPGDTGWYDSGTSTTIFSNWIWNVAGQSRTALTNYAVDSANKNPARSNTGTLTTIPISMTTFHTVAFASTTQYSLSVSGGSGISYGTASPTNDNWFDSGSSTTVLSSWTWNVVSGQSRTAITNYAIDGSSQNPARQGSGTLTTSPISMSASHSVIISSTTQFYLTDTTLSGSEYSITASPTNDGWYDSGTNVNVVLNNIWGTSGGSRSNLISYTVDITTTQISRTGSGTVSIPTITMNTPHTISDSAQTQYQLTLSYSVNPIGSGYSAPSFTANQFGSPNAQTLTASPTGYWFDTGTSWTATNPLGGSTSTERWQTNQVVSGTISSAQTIVFVYSLQYPVTFAVSPSGSGSTSPTGNSVWELAGSLSTSATANNFYAFSNWTSSTGSITFDNINSASATATIGGSGVITGNFFSVPDHLFFNVIGQQTAGTSFTLTITDEDSSGGTITSYSGTPTFTCSVGSITPSSATGGFSNGVWTGKVTLTVAGSGVTIRAIDGTHTGTSNSFTVTHASAANNVVISHAVSSVTAGASTTYSATATDVYGNSWDVTSSSTWSISSGAGGSWSNNVYTSASAGSWRISGTYGSTVYTTTLTVNPAGLDHFVFNTIDSQTSGSSFGITTTAKDAYGNTVTSYTGSPSLTVSDGSISPSTMNAFANGAGSTSVTVTAASSSVSITATEGTHTGTSNSFTLTPTTTPTPSPSPSPTPAPTPTASPTTSPTPTPTPSPSPTPIPNTNPKTVLAKTVSGSTVDLAISGNITSSQISNSTITPDQSLKTTSVSLMITGPNGAVGFVNITIPKTAILYGSSPLVLTDGLNALNQGYSQDANNFYVWFTTSLSTNKVTIQFGEPLVTPASSSLLESVVAINVAIVLVILIAIVVRRKMKT